MSITHGTSTRNAIADAVVDRIDLGTGTSSGRLKLLTSGDAVLVSLPMSSTAFGSASSGTATANAITTTNATGTGTAAKFTVVDRDDNIIFQGTVGTSGADLTITNTSINSGDPISVTSLTYSAPN